MPANDPPQRMHTDFGRRPRTATAALPQCGHLTIDIITAKVRSGEPNRIRGSYPNRDIRDRLAGTREARVGSDRPMADANFEEHELGISWRPDPGEVMQRACHAVRLGDAGRVWIIDPVDVDGLDERVESLAAGTTIAGVLQLLDRHQRDCARLAERYGVALHRLPFAAIAGSGLESVRLLDTPIWREVAIFSPADRALIVPEAVGTAPYFRAGAEPIGIHPMLRLTPPGRLAAYEPEHLLTGHGTGMHGPGTAAALADALAASRRRIPAALASIARRR